MIKSAMSLADAKSFASRYLKPTVPQRSQSQRILESLESGPKSAQKIALEIESTPISVANSLKHLLRYNRVRLVQRATAGPNPGPAIWGKL